MLSRRLFSTARSLKSQAIETVRTPQPTTLSTPPPAIHVVNPPPPPPPAPATVKVKRSIGGFRGGITGFLLGAVVSGAVGYSYLVTDYTSATTSLLASVDDLHQTTHTLTRYISRIDGIESTLGKLERGRVKGEDLLALKREMQRVLSGLDVKHLDLKSKIVELEGELAKLERGQ